MCPNYQRFDLELRCHSCSPLDSCITSTARSAVLGNSFSFEHCCIVGLLPWSVKSSSSCAFPPHSHHFFAAIITEGRREEGGGGGGAEGREGGGGEGRPPRATPASGGVTLKTFLPALGLSKFTPKVGI